MTKQYSVMWFRGMPIGPEALQQNTLYFENLIRTTSKVMCPFSWGIFYAKFDLNNLADGFFKLQELKGINEDFIFFDVDETENLQINLKEYKNDFKNDKKLFIYLSTPKNDYTPQSNENFPKYSTKHLEVCDLNSKSDKVDLSFLKPNYSLSVAETSSLKNDSLPIAQVSFNGMYFKLTNYTYPTQRINNSVYLVKTLKELTAKMKDKIKYLKNIKKPSLEQYNQLSNVSNMVFPLDAALKSDDHPFNIYKILSTCASYAFNFAKKTELPVLESYNHYDITSSFLTLLDYIDSNIDSIFESFKLSKFTKKDNVFEISLGTQLKDYVLVALEKDSSTKYEDILKWISTCMIATNDKIESIKEQRSTGAERSKIESYKDLNIPEIPDMILIKIQLKNVFITQNQTLIIQNDSENLPIPPALFLIED